MRRVCVVCEKSACRAVPALDGRQDAAPTGAAQLQTYGIGGGDVTGASPFFSTALFILLGIIAVAIAVAALVLKKRHKERMAYVSLMQLAWTAGGFSL
jgi:hypothetical protein